MMRASNQTTLLPAALGICILTMIGCEPGAPSGDSSGGSGGSGGAVVSCPEGFADCDGDRSNGCEAALETSTKSCGACGAACEAGPRAEPLCSAGKCIFVCDAGAGDCDGDASNGCEVDLTTDAAHCGACSRACDDTCTDALCGLVLLASEQTPTFLVADEEAVYWSNIGHPPTADGSVSRVPKAGGAATVLASGQASPTGVVVDAAWVYWASWGVTSVPGSLMKAPKGGGAPVVLADDLAAPYRIALDGDFLYWTSLGHPPDYQDGAVMRISLVDPDAAPEVLASVAGRPTALCAGPDALYFTVYGSGLAADGSLQKVGKGPAPVDPAVVIAGAIQAPFALHCTPESIYLTTSASILSFPMAGGDPVPIVSDMKSPARAIVADGASLFWATSSGAAQTVEAAAFDGSGWRLLAAGQTAITDVAVDATHVYWARRETAGPDTGILYALPKAGMAK